MKIPLTKGFSTTVDDTDYDELVKHKWHYDGNYATRTVLVSSNPRKQRKIYMHRHILGDVKEVDHINRNTLDNRRSNLRSATSTQNKHNTDTRLDNTSGIKGVSYCDKGGWCAYIQMNGRRRIRYFGENKEMAIRHRIFLEEQSGELV